jgi:hypothetical protein
MAVGRRLNAYSGMRFDIPHLRSIESATSYDFDSLLRGLFTGINQPYLVRGFDLIIPQVVTTAQNISIKVADSVVLHSSATESGTILITPPGLSSEVLNAATNSKVIGSFQPGVVNYVALDYRRITDTATVDQTAGWSPSQGLEFQRSVPIGKILDYRFVITSNGFGTNLPLYTVKINGANQFEWATKAVPSLFRLGSGGSNPNPQNTFNWGNYNNTQNGINPRREWVNTDGTLNSNPLTVGMSASPDAFNYGDFAITNFKQWMDAVMSRFKEIDGSDYWYVNSKFTGNAPNSFNTWWDTAGSVFTGAGEISYNLILETSVPSTGKFQSVVADPSIRIGELYVKGLTSGTKATLVSYNNSQLVINSLTSAAFIHPETLQVRRVYQPLAVDWTLDNFDFSPNKYGILSRKAFSSSNSTIISSWTFDIKSTATTNLYSLVTVTTSTAHPYKVGDWVEVTGLAITGSKAPNGVHQVLSVAKVGGVITQFTFATGLYLSGTTSATSAAASLDGSLREPHSPFYVISSCVPYSSNQLKIEAKEHVFVAPQSLAVTYTSSSRVVTVSDTSTLKVGMKIKNADIDAIVVQINSTTEIEISSNPAQNGSLAATFSEMVMIKGLSATGVTEDELNGMFTIDLITSQREIVVTLANNAPLVINLNSASIEPILFETVVSVSGANQTDYNAENVKGLIIGGGDFTYVLGPDTLPPLDPASGSLSFDAIIATATVLDPVLVKEITYDHTLKEVIIETFTEHNVINGQGQVITIYGNSSLSPLIRTYDNVTVVALTNKIYKLTAGDVNTAFGGPIPDYENPTGINQVYSRFLDNPYSGPVEWTGDILIKGIIGEIGFVIPQSATMVSINEDPDVSPLADRFNVNTTGTAYLQDGEVLFAKLERNILASNGAVYSTVGGQIFSTPTALTDKNEVLLEPGDWIKWQDEDESKWLRIKTITTSQVVLELENGQAPNDIIRPAKSGPIVYCKGIYDKLYVKKHSLVDVTADVYWIAVRRDSQNKSKVYFRGLEIEAGEVRQISDTVNSNILTYIGAANEGSTVPNYSTSGSGETAFVKELTVSFLHSQTRMITVTDGPEKGFQVNDILIDENLVYYTVKSVLSTRTVIVNEPIGVGVYIGSSITYERVNRFIEDQDNLTLALRKEDRQVGYVDTVLNRPIYDENVYLQQITFNGTGVIKSGEYIWKGTDINNPTALAWVLHGTNNTNDLFAESSEQMPGGDFGSNSAIIHIIFGTFAVSDTVYQGAIVGGVSRSVSSVSSPEIPGGNGTTTGTELVLPPNKRTQVFGAGYVVWPTHSTYKQSGEIELMGEELLVIVNDGIRHAGIDYRETFGGPKAKIKLIRTLPPNTRMRFRVQSSYGSAVAAKAGDASLQSAYNVGATILNSPNRPVQITAANASTGETAEIIRGSLEINGSSGIGGIFNEGSTDQGFVIGKETNKPKEVWSGLDAVKSHSSYPNSAWKRATAAQTVIGDSATIITGSAIALAEGQAYRIRINAVARRSDGTLGVSSFVLEGTFYMTGGVVYAAGSPVSVINGCTGDGYNYAAAFGIQGTNVVLAVYGAPSASVEWAIGMDWQAIGSPS